MYPARGKPGALDIIRGTMVSENINLYTVITALAFKKENGKENHGQTYAHLGAMGLKLWGRRRACSQRLPHHLHTIAPSGA